MSIFMLLCLIAILVGGSAPHVWKAHPHLAILLATLLPVVGISVRYLAVSRENDWEGHGALALTIFGLIWIVLAMSAGYISRRVIR